MSTRADADVTRVLRDLFQVAIDRAHPRHCLRNHLTVPPGGTRLVVVGAGKAAAAMAIAADAHYLGLGWTSIGGQVVTRYGYALENPGGRITITEAAHPVPDAAGEAAARSALEAARQADTATHLLVLLSGGASALWTSPVAGVPFAAKQQLTRDLLRSGATISEINTIRRHLSLIKGGKLARAAANAASITTLAISDVPGDKPEAIGSGPTVADPTTLADAREVLVRYRISPDPAITAALADPANETPKPGDPALARARFQIVAAPQASLDASADLARRLGYQVVMLSDKLEGEARDRAFEHAALARTHKTRGERVAILSGGELTVTLRGAGSGGPNQEYALALAVALEGEPGITALAGDTDGTDGGGGRADDPAGAIVRADTLARASAKGLDARQRLDDNDSTNFFRSLGDLVETGPTQTNVNDFRVILVDP